MIFFVNCIIAPIITYWVFTAELINQSRSAYDTWSFDLKDTTFRINKANNYNSIKAFMIKECNYSCNLDTFEKGISFMKAENILKIKLQDVDEVMSLIKEAIVEMESHRIYQWDEIYPDYQTMLGDIQAETMFGLFKNSELAGIVVLNKEQSPEYSSIKWESDNTSPLVMHRLCVRPKFQRQGIAKQLLNFSEELAMSSNCKSIRLDAFYGNHFALNLYSNNGYKERGTVTFRKGDFYCYEKIIS